MAKKASKRDWRKYEKQIHERFREKYSEHEILFDQKIPGRYSQIKRQVDILVKFRVADVECIGVFDCKCFGRNVDVQKIDNMVGFLDDVGARLRGVVSAHKFSTGAVNRAKAASIDLRTIEFESVEQLVDQFVHSLDFSDSRNSMYWALVL